MWRPELLLAALLLVGCAALPEGDPQRRAGEALATEGVLAIAYSGYREDQHPDRGNGAIEPSRAEVREDLELLAAHGFTLIRMYGGGGHARTTLALIEELGLPIRVLLGAWLDAELSNHAGCPWLDEPIPEAELAANRAANEREVAQVVALANRYPDIVVAVNVGNEALVDWTDHLVPIEQVIAYVRQVRGAIRQPVTVAENWAWWARDGAALADELDFIGVHTYPVWEDHDIDTGLAYSKANIAAVRAALPGHPVAILEAGWASSASEFGDRASPAKQATHVAELQAWARADAMTVFLFEAFDEPWKGNPDNPAGAEKHWGIWDVQRRPKPAVGVLAH